MNYFELFAIPISLQIDHGLIKAKYYDLSRKYHPDFFSQESDSEKDEAEELSAILNKAYKTFQNFDETLQYYLQLKGILTEGEKYELPADFLMEVMDINESITEAKLSGNSEEMNSCNLTIQQLDQDIFQPVKPIIENFDDATITSQKLLALKDYFFKKKYLNRILAAM